MRHGMLYERSQRHQEAGQKKEKVYVNKNIQLFPCHLSGTKRIN